ncbi:hypothetical protein, conserved in T. vivax [Trypanosoma vivax Y486]|uniref:Uncharacterized protein n=1 Tax=Trypanosoma vivax (strain Y486) TaxID=1055687 RepID=F9WM22_TRYVY|nr:hypothetical protein, conserved in T. vivax [Trypanosoma vivax Y486]|eukprot:CCD18572.1 hypothetical protein, conserved in T. vivax [Trypanosoma vivax Y486]
MARMVLAGQATLAASACTCRAPEHFLKASRAALRTFRAAKTDPETFPLSSSFCRCMRLMSASNATSCCFCWHSASLFSLILFLTNFTALLVAFSEFSQAARALAVADVALSLTHLLCASSSVESFTMALISSSHTCSDLFISTLSQNAGMSCSFKIASKVALTDRAGTSKPLPLQIPSFVENCSQLVTFKAPKNFCFCSLNAFFLPCKTASSLFFDVVIWILLAVKL